jgi:hypothetical protein
MRMIVQRYGIEIIPEGDIDEAYIEEVLFRILNKRANPSLKNDCDVCYCFRKNIQSDGAHNLSMIAHIEIRNRKDTEKDSA